MKSGQEEARQLKVPCFLVHLSSSEAVLQSHIQYCAFWGVVEQKVLEWMGWMDGMVINGQWSSESTFGAKK